MNKRTLAFFALTVCVSLTLGAQVLGKIDYIEGPVTITRNGASVPRVDIGTPVENLDLIKTSKDSLVSIVFDKSSGLTGSLQIVAGSSALLRQEQISGTTSNDVELFVGSVDIKVKKIAGMKSAVQVKTPTSVLGVRGTEFVAATFNGAALVATKEGEVYCAPYSPVTSRKSNKAAKSSVPGKLVEILESGDINQGDFPEGEFEKNWSDVQNRWKTFNVDLFVADPVSFLNQFTSNWDTYSQKVILANAALKNNKVLQKWLKNTDPSKLGTMSDWVKERPTVMKDLIDIRPDMVMAMITWYRIQELIPYIPVSEMNRILANGQSVKMFIERYNKASTAVSDAASLFYASEKQYMLRNDGQSPFTEF